MDMPAAIETFTRGFSAYRSITHPFLADRVGRLWYCHDAPRPNNKRCRNPEFAAYGLTPSSVLHAIRKTGEPKFGLCVFHDSDGRDPDLEQAYKTQGLRYRMSEPFFVRSTSPAPKAPTPEGYRVRRATSEKQAGVVSKASGRRQVPDGAVRDPQADARLYAAWKGDEPVGWVTSIRVMDSAWVADLYVVADHRRKGIAGALMACMLRDDARRGITHSVLTASSAGVELYRKLNYQRLGTLQFFIPPKGGMPR